MIEQIKKALEKCTPGEWRQFEKEHVKNDRGTYRFIEAGRGYFHAETETGFDIAGYISPDDAHLIASAPEWLRYLEAKNAELESELHAWKSKQELINSLKLDVSDKTRTIEILQNELAAEKHESEFWRLRLQKEANRCLK